MKSAFITTCLFLAFTTVFSFNENPRNWDQGVLYEKKSGSSFIYLFIDPKGQFIWLNDNGSKVKSVQGSWKRNPITTALKFSSDFLHQAKFIKKPLHVKEEGLFASSSDRPLFKTASADHQQWLLPQIEEAIKYSLIEYDFFSVSEVGKKGALPNWNQEEEVSKDAFEVMKRLGQAEYKAQKWSDQNYQRVRSQRAQWSKLYPLAFAAGKSLFGKINTDSAKVRAMCNWMDEQLKYDLAGSRKNNPDHSPEVIYSLKYGLCLDYARLLNVFCESVGIPCFDIAGYPADTQDGKSDAGKDSYHAWNYVKVNGQWLAVDPTWYNKKKPNEHFLIPLAAYQYEHVPDKDVETANPFAPRFRDEIMSCPVVKQRNMQLVYLGQHETTVESTQGDVRVCIYAQSPQVLYLHVDSLNTTYHMHTFTITFGGGPQFLEDRKGKRHQTYRLQKGVNWITIPLVASVAKYTLINDDFEWSVNAYRSNQKANAFKRLTQFNDSLWCVSQAYQLLENWLAGKEIPMEMTENEKKHPNWNFIRQDYHNQEMDYSVRWQGDHLMAIFEFTSYTIGGKSPIIKMEINDKGKTLTPAKMILY